MHTTEPFLKMSNRPYANMATANQHKFNVTKEINPIMRKSVLKLVIQPSFKAACRPNTYRMADN